MPHKKNANGRHHIPKMRHALTNWAEYDAGLCRRGSLTLWVTDKADRGVSGDPPSHPGRSDQLVLRRDPDLPDAAGGLLARFKLALRQA